MKFAVFFALLGLCLLAVNTHADDDFVEFEPYGLIGVLKIALRSVKGVNCSIKASLQMQTAAQAFINQVNSCGGTSVKQVANLVTACKNVISSVNDLVHLQQNVCQNNGQSESSGCFWKFVHKMATLTSQINKTVSLAKKVPSIPGEAGVCVNSATSQLTGTFTQFPSFVTQCSKLTS